MISLNFNYSFKALSPNIGILGIRATTAELGVPGVGSKMTQFSP
jgi:hypothetical protein